MGIVIREADLSSELDVMRATYEANRESPGAPARFPWLYLQNPDGRATAWLAVDDRSGAVAGFTAVFPRRIRVAGRKDPVVAWCCGDFSIHKRYRTMGVAVKLRRAAKDAVDAGLVPFLYAHPNDRMLAVHIQAGHRQMGRMRRFVKPLSVGSGATAVLTRAALRPLGRNAFVWPRSDAEWITRAPLPADVSEIDDRVARTSGTALVRDTTYLDWRFAGFPLDPIEVLVARRRGRPVAYVAVALRDGTAFVKDWLAVDATAFADAWTMVIDAARRRGAARISVTALETHPDLPRLRWFGFFEREERASAVVTYAAPGGDFEGVLDPRSWTMTVGDRDV